MNAVNLREAVHRIGNKAGVEHVTPQLLRNTAAAIAAVERSSPSAVKDMLGITDRAVVHYLAHADDLPEEHPAHRVWRRVQPGSSRNELLEQADRFIAESSVAIAPVVLVGAALEEYLRGLCRTHGIHVQAPGNIDRFKGLLVREGLLEAPDAKRIERWRDLRNDAAHGRRMPSLSEAATMSGEVRTFIEEGTGLASRRAA